MSAADGGTYRTFHPVVAAARAYRDADSEEEADARWMRHRARLAAAIIRWWFRLPPGARVSVSLPVEVARDDADRLWRVVTAAALDVGDVRPGSGSWACRDVYDDATRSAVWRLHAAARRWAPLARWTRRSGAARPAGAEVAA